MAYSRLKWLPPGPNISGYLHSSRLARPGEKLGPCPVGGETTQGIAKGAMPNDQFARQVEIDWFAAAADLKTLAEAESRERPTLPEYKDRYPLADIPLLALDVALHEIRGSESIGRWCLNHASVDQFVGEFLQIALMVGSGLSFRPASVDALTFLFHTLSLFLVTPEHLRQPRSKYLNLLMRPLADGRVIQVRQILSLIKATELFARHCGIVLKLGRQPIEAPESSALPWLLVQEDENLRPGFVGYPKWIIQPDGRHRIVSTREEHAGLFQADWMSRGIVITPVKVGDTEIDASGAADSSIEQLPRDASIDPARAPGGTARLTTTVQAGVVTLTNQNSQTVRATARNAVVLPILESKRWTRGKWATRAGVSKNSVYQYLEGKRALTDANRKAMAEVLELKFQELPE
jgi:hypothetical protein